MRGSTDAIAQLLSSEGGVLARRRHPELVEQLAYQVRRGRLAAILPGVYVASDQLRDFGTRVRAVMAWDPDAVLVGRAAAKATFWPSLSVGRIEVAAGDRVTRDRGFQFCRRRVPAEFVVEPLGIRCASPSLTALDLCVTPLGGEAIDSVLRARATTLDQLHSALADNRCRRGNLDRRRLLLDSRGEPWSEAERALHRLLRSSEIDERDWEGNWRWETLTGSYYIDVAFPRIKLAIEVDGWEFHSSREAFEKDRWRQNDLVLAGWVVLRFTATMIRDQPQIVLREIERAVSRSAR